MAHRLEVDSILLEFGNKLVLQDVFFHCETGKVIGLLGRNGAGKSCLLNIIYGVLPLVNKSVRLDGKALSRNYRDPNDFRYLPQFSRITSYNVCYTKLLRSTLTSYAIRYPLSISFFVNRLLTGHPHFEGYSLIVLLF